MFADVPVKFKGKVKPFILLVSISLLLKVFAAEAAPLTVAHRGGTADFAENTIQGIELALKNSADIIWITVQLAKDGVPVLYRPKDLKTWTNGSGLVSSLTSQQLARLDAGYRFKEADGYPERGKGVTIPTLKQVLTRFPTTRFFIDIKSPDADAAVMADRLSQVIGNDRNRVVIYSVENRYLQVLPPQLKRFDSRDATRSTLANVLLADRCQSQPPYQYEPLYAYELRRDVQVVEQYTLGEGRSPAQMVWSRRAMDCFKRNPGAQVLLIGINSKEEYEQANALGADYIMVDSPAKARQWRADIRQ